MDGKPFKNFGNARSRELLANWLICAVANIGQPERMTFGSDPTGGDGIIWDTKGDMAWPTEHVLARACDDAGESAERLILERIADKHSKGGPAYAAGKMLIVFLEGRAGKWHPNRVARQLPNPLHFDAVWLAGIQGFADSEYVYAVTRLELRNGNAPTWHVSIGKNFDCWEARRIQ